ncbi:MAG: lipoate--protein ligase [Prevotellaceae bacterium]|jgi:lipoate-protein ligase A|nr:lipoate--protein ligase [Prevotellaceae bacterium]
MQFIVHNRHNPFFNLASEEYLLKNSSDSYFMLWQNEPSVIVGCHQNTAAEVDLSKALEHNIKVARRITGGGAVYHDLGNVNFSLIENSSENGNASNTYAELSLPIIETLAKLGVKAELSGRNDIIADGKKIAGCAVNSWKKRTLLHGAMLFSADLSMLAKVLTPHNSKFEGKAVQSVSSRVANVQQLLTSPIDALEFKQLLKNNIEKHFNCSSRDFTQIELGEIEKLCQSKFALDEWNYNKVSPHSFSKVMRTSGGNVEVKMNFSGGRIENIQLFGDFFSEDNIKELEKTLRGSLYSPEAVKTTLSSITLSNYIKEIKVDELLSLMF